MTEGLSDQWRRRFEDALKANPELRDGLRKIAKAYHRKNVVPQSVMLGKGFAALPESMLSFFGAEALCLSRSGALRVQLSKLLSAFDENQRKAWFDGLLAALGMPSTQQGTHTSGDALVATALERWRLCNPDNPGVYELLKASLMASPSLRRRLASLGEQTIFDQWQWIGEAVRFLRHNRDALTASDLGARFFNDSKALRSGEHRALIADALTLASDPALTVEALRGLGARERNALRERVLREHGVTENPGAIKVTFFGPLRYWKNGHAFDYPFRLWKAGEAVSVSLDNLAGIEKIAVEEPCNIYGCENESPFYALIRGRQPGLIIYTQGFPNDAVRTLWRLLYEHVAGCRFFHWGDTDYAGLRIAGMLDDIAPLSLWRCSAEEALERRARLRPLSGNECGRARSFLENYPAFPFAEELKVAIAEGWLEQESY
jgi:hypothetical protein